MPAPAMPDVELSFAGIADAIDAGGQVLAVPVHPGEAGGSTVLAEAAATLGLDLALALERASGSTGEGGDLLEVPVHDAAQPVRRVLLVGVGDRSPRALRRAGAAVARTAGRSPRVASAVLAGVTDPGAVRAHVEGLLLTGQRLSRKSADRDADRPTAAPTYDLHVSRPGKKTDRDRLEAAVRLGVVTARATRLARDLANTPSNEKDPRWLAEQATDLARRSGLDVRVRDERALAAAGFGGLLSVGGGSTRPPRLIELTFDPGRSGRKGPHVVLVGKGITFDSGGLSLKPREAMVPMKTDMAAGGAVIAVMGALRAAGVQVRVTGLVAAAENMPGAAAARPGDVIRHYGGRTVEVFNTDAEGRLVLADALAYADAELDPDVLVDLATLTGAASQGLGRRHGALYTGDDDLAAALLAAGEASNDRLWRMPLVEDYRAALDSEVADLANVSRDPHVSGGSITAALFLREFAGDRTWAHLDIAGPARAERDEHEVTKGGTGFGARLLLRWLEGLG